MSAAPILELSNALDAPRLSRGALEGLGVVTDHLGRNFDRYDLAELTHELDHQLRFVTRYLREPTPVAQRHELCLQGSRLAALSAGAAFLTGSLGKAWLCYDTAFKLADEINDRTMMTWVVAEQASVACYLGKPKNAADVLQRLPAISDPNQRANAASNAARALSRIGDRTEAVKAIGDCETWCLEITPETDSSISGPMWSFSRISGFTRLGESWISLGMPGKAIEAIDQALASADSSKGPRFGAHARLISASARAMNGQPDVACAIASEVFASFPQDFYTIEKRALEFFEIIRKRPGCDEMSRLEEEFRYYLEISGSRFRIGSGGADVES